MGRDHVPVPDHRDLCADHVDLAADHADGAGDHHQIALTVILCGLRAGFPLFCRVHRSVPVQRIQVGPEDWRRLAPQVGRAPVLRR